MSGISSAFETSAKIIRENLDSPATARRLITERLQQIQPELGRDPSNYYLRNMEIGYRAALEALYQIGRV